jgi:cyclopropane fatty-acyl-phospholipid synthase-like methyltransferase
MTQPDYSPSADRNKHPILEVLKLLVPPQGSALEIASGTGQHVEWFARHMNGWTWQPTEVHRGALYNIEARVAEAGLDNVLEAVQLDVCSEPWFADAHAVARFDLIVCINMLHIAPWDACPALMRGSDRYLKPGGLLVTYGPYFEADVEPTQSNLEFDQSLRTHDASWGIRQRADVEQEALHAGLKLVQRHALPANNLLLVWEHAAR